MACGRAAYVWDWNGGDGWITAESYPEIEADGISGRSGRATPNAAELAADLRRYEASMGPVNHDLVMGHHRANVHAQGLIELFASLEAPSGRPREGLQEMARLVRLEWRARAEVHGLGREIAVLRKTIEDSDARAEEAAREHVERVEQVRRSYEDSLSWRLTAPLRRLTRLLRRFR